VTLTDDRAALTEPADGFGESPSAAGAPQPPFDDDSTIHECGVRHTVPKADPEAAVLAAIFARTDGILPPLDDDPIEPHELITRLRTFGERVWTLSDGLARGYARRTWVTYLADGRLTGRAGPRDAGNLVDEAMELGNPSRNGRPDRRLHFYTDAELDAIPEPGDLVRGILHRDSHAALWGPSGAGKTHIALDFSLSIGTGVAWQGRPVARGPVAYVLGEGRGGLSRRVAAWKAHHGWTGDTGVRFLLEPIAMLDPADVQRLIAELSTWEPWPVLVVLDTLALMMAVTAGDENSTRDMSAYVGACTRIRQALGCTVLTVHHTGTDESRERGNRALRAGMDTMMALKLDGNELVLTGDPTQGGKDRDGPGFPAIRFTLTPAGDSVVPVALMGSATGLTASARKALEALETACLDGESLSLSGWKSSAELSDASFYRARSLLWSLSLIDREVVGKHTRYRPRLTDNERP
jgi:hypothetical protein